MNTKKLNKLFEYGKLSPKTKKIIRGLVTLFDNNQIEAKAIIINENDYINMVNELTHGIMEGVGITHNRSKTLTKLELTFRGVKIYRSIDCKKPYIL